MASFIVREIVDYLVEGVDNEEEAIEVIINADDPNDYFMSVEDRTARPTLG